MSATLQVRVADKQLAAEGIATFDLAAVDGTPLPGFEAGAHIDVHLPGGPVRQYSLYQLPDERRLYRIGVLRDPASRGGSRQLVETVRTGDVLTVSSPRNHFALHAGSGQALLFAGGIGITPILCMAEQLLGEGRDFALHYCGRSLERMAFVERLRRPDLAPRARLHADDGPAEQQLDMRAAIGAPAPERHLYVCGPGGFMAAVLDTARALGWSEANLHSEYFAAQPVDHVADGRFELELRRTGRTVLVEAGMSAAQSLLDAGVPLALSCEQGVCGTCLTRVLGGEPEHRDMYLTEEERARNDCFLPCCSRARTPRLILDI